MRRAGKRPPVAEIMRRAEALEARGVRDGTAARRQRRRHAARDRGARDRGGADEAHGACRSSSSTSATPPRPRCAPFARWAASTRGRKGDVDALAATVLLQHALRACRVALTRARARRRSSRCDRRVARRACGVRYAAAAPPVRVTIPPGATHARRRPTRSPRRGVISVAAPLPSLRVDARRATAASRPAPTRCSSESGWGDVLDDAARRQGLERTSSRFPKDGRFSRSSPRSRPKLGAAGRLGATPRRATPRCCTSSTFRRRRSRAISFPTRTSSRTARRRAPRCDAMVKRFEQVWKPAWTRGSTAARNVAQRRDGAGVDRREGSAAAGGAPGHRGRVSQSPADRHAAPGRSDGAVRARQARRARVLQGSRGRLAVQHVQASRACRRDRSRRPGRRASRPRSFRRTCRTCISSRFPTGITSSARRSGRTRRPCRKRGASDASTPRASDAHAVRLGCEIGTKRARVVQVDVTDVGARLRRLDVQEHADAPARVSRARGFPSCRGAARRAIRARARRARETRFVRSSRDGEDRADDVAAREVVSRDDRLEQLARGAANQLGRVAVDGRRAANRAHWPVTHVAPVCWILNR